jgi:hypothetical protein
MCRHSEAFEQDAWAFLEIDPVERDDVVMTDKPYKYVVSMPYKYALGVHTPSA